MQMKPELRRAWTDLVQVTRDHAHTADRWLLGLGPDYKRVGIDLPREVWSALVLLTDAVLVLMQSAVWRAETAETMELVGLLPSLLQSAVGVPPPGTAFAIRTTWAGQGAPVWRTPQGDIPLPAAHLWVVVSGPVDPRILSAGEYGVETHVFLAFYCPRPVAAAWWSLLGVATGWPALVRAGGEA